MVSSHTSTHVSELPQIDNIETEITVSRDSSLIFPQLAYLRERCRNQQLFGGSYRTYGELKQTSSMTQYWHH